MGAEIQAHPLGRIHHSIGKRRKQGNPNLPAKGNMTGKIGKRDGKKRMRRATAFTKRIMCLPGAEALGYDG
jgi:hypothetical protein